MSFDILTLDPSSPPPQAPAGSQVYLVGGAVRDTLMMQLQPAQANAPQSAHVDLDWVVVGSSPQTMVDAGFQPVGRDFPVFLHPRTHEEYALARTERKTAKGYHGFTFQADPSVTLEQDLARRDLTINAMAVPASAWPCEQHTATQRLDTQQLIDPYGGLRDLQTHQLRHVTDAFAEDPVRILRIARFAARWPHFTVAPETQALMQHMVTKGEVDHLVPERVWQELSRGLMERQPSRMLNVLRDCGALKVLLPEVDRLWGVPQRAEYHPEVDTGIHLGMVLDAAAHLGAPLTVRYACLCHDLGKGTTPLNEWPRHIGHEARSAVLARQVSERWRVPKDCKELADVVAREHGHIHQSMGFGAAAVLRLLERCDAIRRPDRFAEVLLACEADARGRLGFEQDAYPQAPRLHVALQAALAVATAPIAAQVQAQCTEPKRLGALMASAIAQAREMAIAQALGS